MENKIQVNEAIAKLFYEQCMGAHNGHMASIPNNPVLQSICNACGVKTESDFKEFLNLLSEEMPASNLWGNK